MAASQLRCERHRDGARQVCLSQIVDVVVLSHHEALPLTLGASVDLPVQLENDSPFLERKLRRVGVR